MNGNEPISRKIHIANCDYVLKCTEEMLNSFTYEDKKKAHDHIRVIVTAMAQYDIVDKEPNP